VLVKTHLPQYTSGVKGFKTKGPSHLKKMLVFMFDMAISLVGINYRSLVNNVMSSTKLFHRYGSKFLSIITANNLNVFAKLGVNHMTKFLKSGTSLTLIRHQRDLNSMIKIIQNSKKVYLAPVREVHQ